MYTHTHTFFDYSSHNIQKFLFMCKGQKITKSIFRSIDRLHLLDRIRMTFHLLTNCHQWFIIVFWDIPLRRRLFSSFPRSRSLSSRDNRRRSRHLLIILGSNCSSDGTFHVRLLKNHFARFICPLVSFLFHILSSK